MIYVFQGCGSLLTLPCQACGACNKYFGNSCEMCCKSWTKLMERPLCLFVWLTLGFSTYTYYLGYQAFQTGKLGGDIVVGNSTSTVNLIDGKELVSGSAEPQEVCEHPVKMLLFLNFAFAFLHIAFAVYLQSVLWECIRKQVDEEQYQPKKRGFIRIISDSFQYVFCHDIIFCFYVFYLGGTCFANHMGMGWTNGLAGCNPDGYPYRCFKNGAVYAGVVVFFTVGWLMALHCNSCCEMCGNDCIFGRKPLPRAEGFSGDSQSGSGSDSESGHGGALPFAFPKPSAPVKGKLMG